MPNFSNIHEALRYWRDKGCIGLPSVHSLTKGRKGQVWRGTNARTHREWKLVKHGPGSHSCYF